MMYFEPMSGLAVVVQNTPPDTTDVITYTPSVINDSTAAADQLLSAESAQSFMQTQFRMAAENILGLGVVTSGWA
ncbi:MAG: hypothetical protein BCS36_01495 [Desulfovibrio sp. MES5]|uniref:hypothetical protein n=1 Tax=Desulfovibrio sp. MES5 TaxID=1899016 RepID=UPI000B9CD7CA|nr:hypothetical protein [Desulfovibrio sp. MES5]OXS28029.1 MAG: hypothetical protein BCS36_01495 [Desulfovibrio sp. MES5]